jgi:hypothetical protein
MHETVAAPLKAWESFYIIVGSTAGALTGLQFVVLTLIAGSAPSKARKESISAFGSPNVVHFCAALLATAILSAPWALLRQAGLAVAACGLLGIVYSVVVLRRALRQRVYEPVTEDWVWHVIMPMLAYATLFAAGVILGPGSVGALFFVAGSVLLLVFIGIHNAWDTITYITVEGVPGGAIETGESTKARTITGEAVAKPPTRERARTGSN